MEDVEYASTRKFFMVVTIPFTSCQNQPFYLIMEFEGRGIPNLLGKRVCWGYLMVELIYILIPEIM
jgi:hypothetical protein